MEGNTFEEPSALYIRTVMVLRGEIVKMDGNRHSPELGSICKLALVGKQHFRVGQVWVLVVVSGCWCCCQDLFPPSTLPTTSHRFSHFSQRDNPSLPLTRRSVFLFLPISKQPTSHFSISLLPTHTMTIPLSPNLNTTTILFSHPLITTNAHI